MDNPFIYLIILAVICVALIVLVVILFRKLREQKERLDRFLVGQDGSDLEAALNDRFSRISALEDHNLENERAIRDIYSRLQGTYQKMGIVKYNAFTENGGNLSFAMALLNEKDNGYVMNVMNSREGSYVYVKEISQGRCDIPLGGEEEKALTEAKRGKNVRH
ncbi:MAG: DUF4446 family protein [Lachnospiraceae bacterium]|nr:DUF4446 family protein [Lachnospiraceae bacterium]